MAIRLFKLLKNGNLMKYLLLFFCAAVVVFPLYGQHEIGAVLGGSVPVGRFADTDLEEGGFAELGIAARLHYTYRLSPRFGLMALVSFQTQGTDNEAIEASFQDLPAVIEEVRVQPTEYTSVLAMAGTFYEISLMEKVFWRLQAGAGLFSMTLDDQRISAIIETESGPKKVVRTSEAEGESRFSFFAGTTVGYRIDPNFALLCDVLYSRANPTITLTTLEQTPRASKQRMVFINLGVGLVYSF